MKKLLSALVVLFAVNSASAALATYGTRTSFNTAHAGLAVEDFEEGRVGAGSYQIVTGPLNAATSNSVFSPGEILPGLSLVDRPGPDAGGVIVTGTGLFTGSTKAVLANTFADSLDLFFASGSSAVGFDLYAAASPGVIAIDTVTVSAYDLLDNLLGTFTVTTSNTGSVFFGLDSDGSLIGRLNIFSTGNRAETVDNVAFGIGANNVPEPGSLALLGLGLAGLAAMRRRKN